MSAGLKIYVQALGNFRDSETPSRQLNFFVIRGDMCPNGFYGQKKRSQSAQCAVAISNIDMFQDYVIFGVVSFH